MTAFLVLLILWLVLGLTAALVAGLVDREPPPYGIGADYLVSVGVTVLVGISDWFLLPMLGFKPGPLTFAIEVLDPVAAAALALWLMRYLKRRGH